jgi:class 3 adenylate cyclase
MRAEVTTPAAAPVRPWPHRPAIVHGAGGGISPLNGRRPRRAAVLPVHRSILAVDIEDSTQRTNPVKQELRELLYRLVAGALGYAGIGEPDHDPIADLGDGVLVLLRPADELPKPLLVSRLVPALAGLLAARNGGISPAEQPRIMRLRAAVHAGEVVYDGKAPFGEDLDVAFRLLDAPKFKAHTRRCASPVALVVSDYIYDSVIRHGYDGIDGEEFRPLVTVNVGRRRRRGWVHLPAAAALRLPAPAHACVG